MEFLGKMVLFLFVCCLRGQGICALPHELSMSMKEIINTCLTSSVRILV